MRKSIIAASALYLLALPCLAIVMLTSPNLPLGLLPAILTIACIHIGLALGPRVGFRSLMLDQLSGQRLTGLGSGWGDLHWGADFGLDLLEKRSGILHGHT